MRRPRLGRLGGLLALAAAGCTRSMRLPDLHGLYRAAAQRHGPARNPVIVIPGILGSRLRDGETGRVVSGAFSGDYADPRSAEGARLVALPMAEGVPLAELRDGVVPDGVLDRVHVSISGLPLEAAAYVNILAALGVGGYRDQTLGNLARVDYGAGHFTCFQFDYDWRRDLAENARRLAAFVREKRA